MKKTIFHITLLMLVNFGISTYLPAQEDECYIKLRSYGIHLLSQENFSAAIDKFIAARFCLDKAREDDLDQLIRSAQGAWVKKLEEAEQRALTEAKRALLEKEKAESEKRRAEALQVEAQLYADKAWEEALRAEANRLALQAEAQLKEGHQKAALYLAFLAVQLTENHPPPYVRLSFGRAAYENFDQSHFIAEKEILAMQALKSSPVVLLTLPDHTIVSVSLTSKDWPIVAYHDSHIIGLRLTSAEDKILTFSSDKTARLWNREGCLLVVLKGHKEEVLGAIFSPDERMVLSWSSDDEAKLWDTNGQLLATLAGHRGNIYEGSFSPDGKKLLTRSSDGSVCVWDTTGEQLYCIKAHRNYVYSAEFSPNGSYILTASADSTIRAWDNQGQEVFAITLDDGLAREARYSPDGYKILVRGVKDKLMVFNENGQLISTLNHSAPLLDAQFGTQGTILLSWAADNDAYLWNIHGDLLTRMKGHHGYITAMFPSKENDWFLTTGLDGYSRLWDNTGDQVMPIRLKDGTSLPAQFSAFQQRPVYVKGRNSLNSCPLPSMKYLELKQNPPFTEEDKAAWKETFKISDFVLEPSPGKHSVTPPSGNGVNSKNRYKFR